MRLNSALSSVGDRRTPGSRAGLSLEQIVAEARRLDPSTLTMRGLAKKLHVDHKALNHYVRDRDSLMGILAWDAFSTHASAIDLTGDWRAGCQGYAYGCADAAVAVGSLAGHLKLNGAPFTNFLETSESLIALLLASGFDDETALRSVALLTNICLAYAQDVVGASVANQRRRRDSLRAALVNGADPALPNLSRILAEEIDTYDRKQLELSVTVFIAGMESLRVASARNDDGQASGP